jgi:hypothetical protein
MTALVVETLLIFFGRTGTDIWGRYTVVPGMLLLFSLYLIISLAESRFGSKFYSLIFAIFVLCSGISTLFQPKLTYLKCDTSCVSWRDQVRQIYDGDLSDLTHWPYAKGYSTNYLNPQERLQSK